MVMNRNFRAVRNAPDVPDPESTPDEQQVKRRRRKRDDQGNLIPLEDEVTDVPPTQTSPGQGS